MKYFKFAIFLLASCVTPAYATILMDIQEVGADVVVSYSGTLDLNSTAYKEAHQPGPYSLLWSTLNGGIQTYNAFGPVDDYNLSVSSIVRPTITKLFSGVLSGGIGTGDSLLIDISGSGSQIWVPEGYVSNAFLSGTNTFSNVSFSDLAPILGTFEWSWYNGDSSDNLILTVSQAESVPEPAAIALLGIGLAGIGFSRKKKNA